MNKRQYLITALKAGAYRETDWLVSIFCMFDGDNGGKPYAYKLSKNATGYLYTDLTGEQQRIEGSDPTKPLFYVGQGITVKPEDADNVTEPQDSTVGTLIANYILLIHAFGKKLPYINKKIAIGNIEAQINTNFYSTPKEGEERKPDAFYVDEYLNFGEAAFHMTCLTQVCTIGATEKSVTAPDGIAEYKAQLQKEYAGRLNDPAYIAEMNQKLQAFDRKWREGDESNDFLLTSKSTEIVRHKKFLQLGGELGVGKDSIKVNYLGHSLDEGHTLDSFAAVNTTQRMGAFARGAETMLGGVQVKEAFRASRTYNVVEGDCGTKLGVPKLYTKDLAEYLATGYTIISDKGANIKITDVQQLSEYQNRYIVMRSPMYCKSGQTDYCSVCVGPKLALTPNALATSFSDYGNVFMKLSMAQNHGKVLALQELSAADWMR